MKVVRWADFAAAAPELAASGLALLYERGDGEGLMATLGTDGAPRIHPLNVGVLDGRLLVFIQGSSAKARDLASNRHYAVHAHQDPARPNEFLVRGTAELVTDPTVRSEAAGHWFFDVNDDYPLYELRVGHALLGERRPDEWPPRYETWRPSE